MVVPRNGAAAVYQRHWLPALFIVVVLAFSAMVYARSTHQDRIPGANRSSAKALKQTYGK